MALPRVSFKIVIDVKATDMNNIAVTIRDSKLFIVDFPLSEFDKSFTIILRLMFQ